MKRVAIWFLAVVLGSCAGPAGRELTVRQFTMRDMNTSLGDDLLVRAEIRRHLYGAISPSERKDRLGQYFAVLWKDPAGAGPVEVVFEFQQAGTAALVKRRYERFDAAAESGRAEFSVNGEDFRKNGRVLAWRVVLRRGGREVATRKSYLWR